MEIKTVKVEYREDIISLANRMLKLASPDCTVQATFNGIPLTTEGANRWIDILKQCYDYEKKQDEDYINSGQYALDKEAINKKLLDDKKEREELFQEFRNLNLNSVPDVVNWIGRMSNCNNDIFVNTIEVLPMLKASGYQTLDELFESNPNKGINITVEEYIKFDENLDEVGNYIISRAISDIENLGNISDVLNYFVQIYEQRLNEQNKNDNDLIPRVK